jgi:3-hydroxybutyryl-CoA dehydrogenase
MEIRTAAVVGLGTMGAGIAEVFARAGLDVVAVEVTDVLLDAGRDRLEQSLAKAVERGKLTAVDRDAVFSRVTFSADRSALSAADLVIEAIPERLELKADLFADLDRLCPPTTIFATNTSSLPVTRIAAASGRPGRVVGMHFFNPAPVMRLVEVVHTVLTDPEVVTATRDLAECSGKTPVVVGDRAGFVANALLFGYLNDAARAAETRQAAVADIDAAVAAACGLPMGPLTLLDLIGLDVSLEVLETMFDETRDQRYAPSPLLRRMVMAGQLGRKSGRGYYDYSVKPAVATIEASLLNGTPRPNDKVVAVVGAAKSAVMESLGGVAAVVPVEDVGDADVVVVDGGSRTATAELCARVAARARSAVIALATTDEAPLATLAAATGRVGDIVGLHVPLPPRPGVMEIVASRGSSPDAIATAADVVRHAGLIAVPCRDRPGHVVESIVLPHLADAVRMVDDGYATVGDVDTAMTLGCGYSSGPFTMLDAVGADHLRSWLVHLAAATHRPSLAPPPLLDELASLGPPSVRR